MERNIFKLQKIAKKIANEVMPKNSKISGIGFNADQIIIFTTQIDESIEEEILKQCKNVNENAQYSIYLNEIETLQTT